MLFELSKFCSFRQSISLASINTSPNILEPISNRKIGIFRYSRENVDVPKVPFPWSSLNSLHLGMTRLTSTKNSHNKKSNSKPNATKQSNFYKSKHKFLKND